MVRKQKGTNCMACSYIRLHLDFLFVILFKFQVKWFLYLFFLYITVCASLNGDCDLDTKTCPDKDIQLNFENINFSTLLLSFV